MKPYLFKIIINHLKIFSRKRKILLPLNKDIEDEESNFRILNFLKEETEIFEKLNKKEKRFFNF